jgi:DNA-binding MurR/RpiR family transcriptional regulator
MYIIHARLLNVLNDEPLGSIDRHVATVMLEHISELADLSIGELADRCTVSKSTLSKFVRKLGFEDYIDFKLEAKRQREKEIYIHGQKTTKWLRTSGITAGIPVAAPLHHMDERLMHPEERRKQWRRAMQAD